MEKKNKIYNDLTPPKQGKERVDELMRFSDDKTDFLPPSITFKDLDTHVLNKVKDGDLSMKFEGKPIPVIFFPSERWGEIEKNWQYFDDDSNLQTTFFTLKRVDSQRGTHAITKYGVPNRKKFTTYKVPKFDGFNYYEEIYKIPQPLAVDLIYELKLVTKKIAIQNEFDVKFFTVFNDRQTYIFVNGQYLPIIDEGGIDESRGNETSTERILLKTYKLKLQGLLINEEEFEVTTTTKRIITDIQIKE